MTLYRKKPVVIEAVRWTGLNDKEISNFIRKGFVLDMSAGTLIINTLEGPHHANIGDYIIMGVAGEYYPCKPDIFSATYDEVEVPDELLSAPL